MNPNLLSSFWTDLSTDLGNLGLRWQIGALLLRIAIPLIGSCALICFYFYVMRRIFAKGGQVGNFDLLFEKSCALLVWCVVSLYITGLLLELEAFLELTTIPLGTNRVSIMKAQATISVDVTLSVTLWASSMLEERLMRLSMVGIDLTVLSVFGGTLGVGLGLCLQKIASSYVSGFLILLERSLSIGDMVAVDRFFGRVAKINTRYTVLRTGDGSSAVVPNDLFVPVPCRISCCWTASCR